MIKCVYNEQGFNALAAGATANSSDAAQGCFGKWFPCEEFTGVSVHVVLAGADHVDGAVKLQVSNQPTPSDSHAIDFPSASVTLSSNADFSFSVDMNKLTYRWARLVYAHGSNTTGTVDAYVTLKG